MQLIQKFIRGQKKIGGRRQPSSLPAKRVADASGNPAPRAPLSHIITLGHCSQLRRHALLDDVTIHVHDVIWSRNIPRDRITAISDVGQVEYKDARGYSSMGALVNFHGSLGLTVASVAGLVLSAGVMATSPAMPSGVEHEDGERVRAHAGRVRPGRRISPPM